MRAGGTRRILPWLSAFAATLAGLTLVALVPAGDAPLRGASRPLAASAGEVRWLTAQAQMGFACQTDFGRCSIAPQPVGSPCWCGSTPGFVVN